MPAPLIWLGGIAVAALFIDKTGEAINDLSSGVSKMALTAAVVGGGYLVAKNKGLL